VRGRSGEKGTRLTPPRPGPCTRINVSEEEKSTIPCMGVLDMAVRAGERREEDAPSDQKRVGLHMKEKLPS